MSSNQIKVLFFGQIAEYTLVNQLILNDFYDTDAVIAHLNFIYPRLQDSPYQLAVDKEIIHENTAFTANHILALLPPYAGG